jgi:hypothetical protein
MHATAAFPFLLLLAPAFAQRAHPKFEWQKRETVIDYGAVPLGRHSLDELKVGESWRLGFNEASTWTLGMPILLGNRVLPPGGYRIQLERSGEEELAICAVGSGLVAGAEGRDIRAEGRLGKGKRPTDKLVIEWHLPPDERSSAQNQPVQLIVRYGEHEWLSKPVLLGGKSFAKIPGWAIDVFAVPAASVAARDQYPVVVAAFEKKGGKAAKWNLVLGKDVARLVPQMRPTTESFGFGKVEPPDPASITTGTLSEGVARIETRVVELREGELKKGAFELELVAGKKLFAVSVPAPGANKAQ